MENTTSQPSGSEIDKLIAAVLDKLVGKPEPNLDKCLADYIVIPEFDIIKAFGTLLKDIFKEIPEADLEDVILEYIPDSIRELRTKREYWKQEFCFWDDVISKKNWKLYDRKLRDKVIKHKSILKNMDKMLEIYKPKEDKNLFSASLDVERVHNLVTSIKEKKEKGNKDEIDDIPFQDMMRSEKGDEAAHFVQFLYTTYAIYASKR